MIGGRGAILAPRSFGKLARTGHESQLRPEPEAAWDHSHVECNLRRNPNWRRTMEARNLMTADPACCSPSDTVKDAAGLMVDNDCGEIPVVDESGGLVGVVTDRDIACRCVAKGKSADTPVEEVMSSSLVTVTPDTSIEECCKKMEDNQVRRLPVVDDEGKCCGIVSQADIALHADKKETGDLVREVSESTEEPAAVGCC
ncbi:CBS domain-containing protein [Sphingopyxis chilensis]|jgi:CBS domain-containing protein|tara:strand:- start:43 stop:642 length:600 start_codon:yes stop_codon:yes gene_type:complete